MARPGSRAGGDDTGSRSWRTPVPLALGPAAAACRLADAGPASPKACVTAPPQLPGTRQKFRGRDSVSRSSPESPPDSHAAGSRPNAPLVDDLSGVATSTLRTSLQRVRDSDVPSQHPTQPVPTGCDWKAPSVDVLRLLRDLVRQARPLGDTRRVPAAATPATTVGDMLIEQPLPHIRHASQDQRHCHGQRPPTGVRHVVNGSPRSRCWTEPARPEYQRA